MDAGRLNEPLSERVRRDLRNYTAAERRVAQSLLSDYPVAGLETVARFAQRAGTSGPTILRFVSRLGLKSYAEFQNCLRSEVQERLQGPLARYPSLRSWGEGGKVQERVGSALCRNIERAVRSVSPKEYAVITELVCCCTCCAWSCGTEGFVRRLERERFDDHDIEIERLVNGRWVRFEQKFGSAA